MAIIDSAPTTVAKGETGINIDVSDASTAPTTANATATVNGAVLAPTSVTGSGPWTLNFDVPVDIATIVGTYPWTITVDAETVATAGIPLTPQTGWSAISLVDPVFGTGSIINGFQGDTPVTGDSLEYQTTASLTVNADGTWVWGTLPAATTAIPRRVIQADGTVGDTASFTYLVSTLMAAISKKLGGWMLGLDGRLRGLDKVGLLGIAPGIPVAGWTGVTFALNATGTGTRIDVGGGNNDHADLSTLDPGTLTAGSVVNIYHRVSNPYNTKYVFHKSGTSDNPITINGVTDIAGNRPEIDFAGATTQNMQDGHVQWVAPYAGWTLTYGREDGEYGVPVQYMDFLNLDMHGAGPENVSDGGVTYVEGASPLRFNEADYINIAGCIFRDNGNGIFMGSGQRANKNFHIKGSKFYGNGVVGSYLEHNLYFQAVADIPFANIVEGCYFGPLRAGAIGNSSMKHRGTDLIFRYNTVICQQRALDLVEAQDSLPAYIYDNFSAQEILDRYRTSYVYGNQFFMDESRGFGAAYGIHVGMDTGTNNPTDDQTFGTNTGSAQGEVMARGYQSPVYFYNNSFYANNPDAYYQSFFDTDAGSSGATRHFGEVVSANNVVHFDDTDGTSQGYVSHLRHTGQLTYEGVNHIRTNGNSYATLNEGRDLLDEDDADITIIGGVNPTLEQSKTGLDPLFADTVNANVELISLKLGVGSSAIGAAAVLTGPMATYPALLQPVLSSDGGGAILRDTTNNLGAYE